MDQFDTARDAAYALRPDQPIYCFRPEVLRADALAFKSAFPGKTAYAVKTNGEPMVLKTLAEAGIDCFDVASPAEFAAVRAVAPKAELLYMHPVKAQSDIRLALETYGIRVLAARSRGRGREDPADRPRPRSRPGGDHAVRPARRARPRRLRAVEEVRRGAGPCGRTGRAHRRDRLPGRALLPCRQPGRGHRHL